jgi:hypothetical protein
MMDVGLVQLVGCWMLHSCHLMDDGCCGYGLYVDLCDIYVDFCDLYIYVLWLLRYMRQSGKNSKKTHLPALSTALQSWKPSCKNPSFADYPWWWLSVKALGSRQSWLQSKTKKRKIYRLPP